MYEDMQLGERTDAAASGWSYSGSPVGKEQ